MSKKNAPQDGLLSPYLSLRAAVRPAAASHALLAREQDRAGALVGEAEELLTTTRQRLEAAGLVQILSPGRAPEIYEADSNDGRLAEVVTAYAEAGMLWAKILGISVSLAEALAQDDRHDEASQWIETLKGVGEGGLADNLSSSLEMIRVRRLRSQLSEITITTDMSLERVGKTIDILTAAFDRWAAAGGKPETDQAILWSATCSVSKPIYRLFLKAGVTSQPELVGYLAKGNGVDSAHMLEAWYPQVVSDYETVRTRDNGQLR